MSWRAAWLFSASLILPLAPVADENPVTNMTMDEKLALSARWDLGYYLFQIQEYGPAALEFEKIRSILPEDASLLALIGSCQTMSGNGQAGERTLQHALALSPADPDINNILGQLYLSRHQPLRGAVYLETSLRLLPDQEDVRMRVANLYLQAGQYPQARVHLEILLAGRASGEFGDAELEYGYARTLAQSGEYAAALTHAQRAHESQPTHPGFAHILGQCLMATNRFAEAARALQSARAALTVDPDVYLQLGQALFLDRRWDEAERAWVEGARKFPASYALLSRLMEFYLGTARPEQAAKVAQFAHRRNPGNPGNLLLESRLGRKLGSYSMAWKSLGRLKRQACGRLAQEAWWEEAQLDFETGRASDCVKVLDRLIAAGHRPSEAHLLRARLDLQSGRRASAQAHVLEARKLNPYDLKVYALAREAFSGNQDRETLAGLFQEALDLMPDSDYLYAQSEGLLPTP